MDCKTELTKLIAGASEFQAKVILAFARKYLSRQEFDMNYKREIINLINNVESAEFLEFVYKFIKQLKLNWGL